MFVSFLRLLCPYSFLVSLILPLHIDVVRFLSLSPFCSYTTSFLPCRFVCFSHSLIASFLICFCLLPFPCLFPPFPPAVPPLCTSERPPYMSADTLPFAEAEASETWETYVSPAADSSTAGRYQQKASGGSHGNDTFLGRAWRDTQCALPTDG